MERAHAGSGTSGLLAAVLEDAPADGSGVGVDATQKVAAVKSSSGAPLPDDMRAKFEKSTGADLSAVRVICVVETTGHAHVNELHAALAAADMSVVG